MPSFMYGVYRVYYPIDPLASGVCGMYGIELCVSVRERVGVIACVLCNWYSFLFLLFVKYKNVFPVHQKSFHTVKMPVNQLYVVS